MSDDDTPVDLKGIHELLKVAKHTPHQWRQREVLPPVDFPELTRPLWKRKTIILWAANTGRLPASLMEEARRLKRLQRGDIQPDILRGEPESGQPKPGIPAALFIAPELDDQGLSAR
ncbi:MAG TPA: hypothetical protein VIY48_20330 [Candidatus Paceibacterota bacterium]